jgi:hypothetical protein
LKNASMCMSSFWCRCSALLPLFQKWPGRDVGNRLLFKYIRGHVI